PTQPPVVQPVSDNSPTPSAVTAATPNQLPIVQAFSEDSSPELASAETIPTPDSEVQSFSEAAADESVAEGITSSESSLVQAFSETEALPELPKVLKNLAPSQPLGSSKPLAQQSDFSLETSSAQDSRGQPTNLQRTLAEASSQQTSVVSAFSKAAPAESVAAEMMPHQESVDQTFVEPAPATS
ncbi:MAG TPA: hypothetical protein DCP31_11615, partial [Cyanobacteria bacterium UBA8543]|nr:hypothetical protein [Cyanobacteria bacterium UBA8543]